MRMNHRPIVAKPRLTQDWGDHQHERETHWTSLFYDLLLVAALNALAEPFEEFEEETGELVPIRRLWGEAILKFAAIILPWNNLNEYTSMYSTESLLGHLLFFVHCFGIAATTQACVGDLSQNYVELATGMVLTRFGLIVLWARPMIYLPRVRVHGGIRLAGQVVSAGLVAAGAAFAPSYGAFLRILVASNLTELASMLAPAFLSMRDRIPFHVMGFSARMNEITMVVFGEAIFAIVLRPFHDDSSGRAGAVHYYAALLGTLWLIYSLALQEFHILPEEEQHALRRSVLAGATWINTNVLKQVFLLGSSVGIKRIHLLTFVAPTDPVDDDTIGLLVWGFSLTLMAVVVIRSCSYGFRPVPDIATPELLRTQRAWWAVLILACAAPHAARLTLFPRIGGAPINIVLALGTMMVGIILAEAVVLNRAADLEQEIEEQQAAAKPEKHEDEEHVATEVSHLLGELD